MINEITNVAVLQEDDIISVQTDINGQQYDAETAQDLLEELSDIAEHLQEDFTFELNAFFTLTFDKDQLLVFIDQLEHPQLVEKES